MVRDRTARARIREHLLSAGSVTATSGNATNALREAVGYQGSAMAFIQLVSAMERDGEIERDIRGKRTYRIAPGPRAAAAPERPTTPEARPAPDPADIDYQQLARAIVQEMLTGTDGPGPSTDAERLAVERDDYIRRLQDARSRIDELLGEPVEAAGSSETR